MRVSAPARADQLCRLSAHRHSAVLSRLAPDIQAGSNVRVKADLVVYHVPKNKELQLKGWEGEVAENVVDYKGTKISANLPYKVQFIKPTEGEGKDLKFFCHLVSVTLQGHC